MRSISPTFPPWPVVALVVFFAACTGSSNPARENRPDDTPAPANDDGQLLEAELSTVGWDTFNNAPVVLLRELKSGQILPIWIGIAEARAIDQALQGIEAPRPGTHDLMASLVSALGAEVEELRITELREGTYFGLLKLHLQGDDEPRWVDTRPSDGLALALRTGALIRLAPTLFDDLPEFDFLAPESPEQVVRAFGLTVVAPSDKLRQELSLPERQGIVVIRATGAAERQGLRRGDLIVEINGEIPSQPVDLLEAVQHTPPGVPLRVTYWRDGKETTIELLLGLPDPEPSTETFA